VDAFTLIVAGGLGLLVVVFLLIGFLYPGSGAEVLDWKPTRSAEAEAENELDDVSQMIAAQNEMRRRRGAAERSEADVKASVERDKASWRTGRRPTPPSAARRAGRWTSGTSEEVGDGEGAHRGLRLPRPGAGAPARRRRPRRPRHDARPGEDEAIRAAGAEPYVGDPDRIATLMEAVAGTTIVCWLLASAEGEADAVAALHGPRLRMLWEKIVDTPVRGVVYEAAGTLPDEVLAEGRRVARTAHETWVIPLEVLAADPADHAAWVDEAAAAVDRLLAG
jgi:hypothetical protein